MLLQNSIVKLRNDFAGKIREEWSSKWEAKFGKLTINESFPTSNDFLIDLSADISKVLSKKGLSPIQIAKLLPSTDTLKRQLKSDYGEGMREKTRECLSLYLDYKSYYEFIQKHVVEKNTPEALIIVKKSKKWVTWTGIVGGFTSLLVFILLYQRSVPSSIIKPRIIKVHLGSEKAPITAKIDYDLGNMPFDSAYLDFEWKDRVGIDKQKKSVFFCFLHPTRRTAKLIVDGKCVDSTQIVIPSDGWMMGYESIYYVDKKKWQKNDVAHLAAEDVAEEFTKKGYYTSFIKKVGGFDDISCDDFSFEARLKNPRPEGTVLCSDATVMLIGTKNKLYLNLTQMGCFFYSYVKLNDGLLGQTQDFQNLSVNLNEFVNLNIKTNNQKIEIFIDEKLAFATNYSQKLGNLEAVNIAFQNSGSVDYMKGTNIKTRKLLFFDDFDK